VKSLHLSPDADTSTSSTVMHRSSSCETLDKIVEIRWIFANPNQVGSDTITDFFSDIYSCYKCLVC
jgi:hypothetical protein